MNLLTDKNKDLTLRRKKDRREMLWRMEDEGEEEKLMAKSESGGLQGTDQLENKLNSTKGGGTSLDTGIKSEMESKMDADLSSVKIHNDSNAHEMSEGINAKAFTHGQDIYFKEGNYNTSSTEGKHLLAHELTHTQQQKNGLNRKIQRQTQNTTLTTNTANAASFSVTIKAPEEIKYGDTNGEAMRLLFGNMFILDPKDYRVLRSASDFNWKYPFPGLAKDASLSISVPNEIFLKGLAKAYQNENVTGVYRMNVPFSKLTEPFNIIQQVDLIMLARLYGSMTDVDVEYYNKWLVKEYSDDAPKYKTENLSFDIAIEHFKVLEDFNRNKYEYLADEGLLKDYSTKESTERDLSLYDLIEKLNSIDATLLEQALDILGTDVLEYSDFYTQPGFFGIMKRQGADKVNTKLEETGFSLHELVDFMRLFNDKAIGTAFTMLAENKELLLSEGKRYKNISKFIELYRYIKTYFSPRYREADKVRAVAAISVVTQMCDVYGVPASAGGKLTRDIYNNKNDPDAVAELISEVEPRDLIRSLSGLIDRKKLMDDPIKYYKDKIPIFNDNPVLMFTGNTPEAQLMAETEQSHPGFYEANKMDIETTRDINQEGGKKFPILYDLSFNFRRLSSKNAFQLYLSIQSEIEEKLDNNDEVTKALGNDAETVWKLELVIAKTKRDLQIEDGTNAATIIQDYEDDKADAEFWKSIGLGALGIVIGIAGFFTGGAAWAGYALMGIGLTLSIYDLVVEIQNYNFRDAARDTAIGTANELSAQEPSMLGVVLAVLGLVLDVVDLVKAVLKPAVKTTTVATKTAQTVTEEYKTFQQGCKEVFQAVGDPNKLDAASEKLYGILKGRLKGNPSPEQFKALLQKIIDEERGLQDMGPEYAKLIGDFTKQIDGLAELMSGPIGMGFKRLFKQDPEVAKMLLNTALINRKAFMHLSMEALIDKEFSKSLSELSSLMKGKIPVPVLVSLSNNMRKELNALPNILQTIKRSGVTDPRIISDLVINKKLRDLVMKMEDPAELTALYNKYKKSGIKSTFTDYALANAKQQGRLKIGDVIENFDTLTDLRSKNLALLRSTEPRLVKAIEDGVFDSNPALKKAIENILKQDAPGSTAFIDVARGNIVKQMNKAVGENIKDMAEFQNIIKLIDEPGSQGAITDYFFAFNYAGKGTKSEKLAQVLFDGDVIQDASKGVRPDRIRPVSKRTLDVKSGYASSDIDVEQLKNYEKLIDQSRVDGSQVQKMLNDLDVKGGLNGHDYVFLPGKGGTSLQAAERAFNLITKTLGDKSMEKFGVYFIDEQGKMFQYLGKNIPPEKVAGNIMND